MMSNQLSRTPHTNPTVGPVPAGDAASPGPDGVAVAPSACVPGPLTLAALARARGLSPDTLHQLGWQERTDGIVIPWPLAGGGAALHIRHTLEKAEGQRRWSWAHFNRSRILPYGHDRLSRMREQSPETLVIVESEVDAVCLWTAGLAALATAGAEMWQGEWWALTQGFGKVVLWLEDGGTLALLRKLAETQPDEAPPLSVCHALGLPGKDSGRLLAAMGDAGKEALRRIVARAVPVTQAVQSEDELPAVVAERLSARPGNAGFSARCPFHPDDDPSLSVFRGEDGWAFRCHAGSCGARGPLSLLAGALGFVPPTPDRGARGRRGRSDSTHEPLDATNATVATAVGPGPAVESNNPSRAAPVALFRFRSPGMLLAATPEQTPWLWQGYLARGALTVLGAREKAGKSSLTWALIAALLSGRDFCGRPTSPTPVVVLTEEPPTSVAEKLERFGIAPDAPLSILTRADVRGRPQWDAVVAAAGAEAERIGAGIIVIDPLAFWAALPPDAENSAGAMTEALRPVLELAGRGLAVLALHHVDKAHGELRGSTAIGAAADIIVTLTREAEAPSRRRLEVVGRFSECPAEPVLIELDGDRYAALGSPREVSAEERERQVLGALSSEPPGLTQKELAAATGLSQQRVAEALGALRARGWVARTGQGNRGAPYRYWRQARGGDGGVDSILPPPQGDRAVQLVESSPVGERFDSTAGPGYRTEEKEASNHSGRPPSGVGDDPAAQAHLRETVWRLAERLRWPRIAVTPIWVVHGPAGWQGFRMVAERQELWWAAWQALQALMEQADPSPRPSATPLPLAGEGPGVRAGDQRCPHGDARARSHTTTTCTTSVPGAGLESVTEATPVADARRVAAASAMPAAIRNTGQVQGADAREVGRDGAGDEPRTSDADHLPGEEEAPEGGGGNGGPLCGSRPVGCTLTWSRREAAGFPARAPPAEARDRGGLPGQRSTTAAARTRSGHPHHAIFNEPGDGLVIVAQLRQHRDGVRAQGPRRERWLERCAAELYRRSHRGHPTHPVMLKAVDQPVGPRLRVVQHLRPVADLARWDAGSAKRPEPRRGGARPHDGGDRMVDAVHVRARVLRRLPSRIGNPRIVEVQQRQQPPLQGPTVTGDHNGAVCRGVGIGVRRVDLMGLHGRRDLVDVAPRPTRLQVRQVPEKVVPPAVDGVDVGEAIVLEDQGGRQE
jgi:hypothetical protein